MQSTVSIGDWCQVITAMAAVSALVFGVAQVLLVRAAQREATASLIWSEMQKLAIAHPTLASPHAADLNIEAKTFDGSYESYVKYAWFVSYVLLACEEVLRLNPTTNATIAIEETLFFHRSYLRSKGFDHALAQLAPELRRMVENLRSSPERKSAS